VQVVGGANDLGADVIATTPDGRRIVIQAKRYQRHRTVGSQAVQVVNGTYQHQHGAHLAAIVTTATFTKPARNYANQVG
jgi:restriction system protein